MQTTLPHNRRRFYLHAILGLLVAMLVLTSAAFAQETRARISATLNAEYGRIVVYGALPRYEVKLIGDTLMVDVGTTIETDLDQIQQAMPDVITRVGVDKNGTRLLLQLKDPNVVIRKFRESDYAGVDVVYTQKRKAPEKQPEKPPAKKTEPKKPPTPTTKPAVIIPPKLQQETPKPSVTTPATTPEKPNGLQRKARYSPSKMVFPFTDTTGAAVYTQQGATWVIFDKPVAVDIAKLNGVGQMVTAAEQVPNRYYTIVQLKHPNDAPSPRVSVTRDSFNWVVDISDQPDTAPQTVPPVESESKDYVSLVLIKTIKTSEPMFTVNTSTGRRQVIVPLQVSDTGIYPARSFVDFDLPATHQGLVIEYKRDDILTKVVRDGVRITSQMGLNIFAAQGNVSSLRARLGDTGKRKPDQTKSVLPFNYEETMKRVFGESYAEWESGIQYQKQQATKTLILPDEDTTPLKRKLEDAVRTAPLEQKDAARMKLADFYFGSQFYPEALGVLEWMKQENPSLQENPNFQLKLAALHLLTGRYEQAEALMQPLLEKLNTRTGLPELQILRWANNQLLRPRTKQIAEELPQDLLSHYDAYLQDYPTMLRQKLGLLAIDYWLDKNADRAAEELVQMVEEEKPDSTYILNRLLLAKAKLAERDGRSDEAREMAETVTQDIDDREARALAGYHLAMMSYEKGVTPLEDTLKTLNQLTYAWRGGDLELELLGRIGQLYMESGNYLDSLRTWKVLVTNFPDTQESLYTAGKMKQIFVNLFDEGLAYKIPPLQALALFFEFRELTPVGEQGDRIVRKLVDYFIGADLLENAAAILTHQVRFRATGDEQLRLAMKLAGVHLQNRRPDLALEVMEFISGETMTPDIITERKLVKARALAEQEKFLESVQVLEGDESKAANAIRLDVLFKMQNWFGVMRLVEARLPEIKEAPQHMKERDANELTMLAIAYSHQNERQKLAALRKDFLTTIPMRDKRLLFSYLTSDPGEVDYRKLNYTVQIEDISEFLTRNIFWPEKEWVALVRTLSPIVNTYQPSAENPLSVEQKEHIFRLAIASHLANDQNAIKQMRLLERAYPDLKFGGEFQPLFVSLTRVGDPIAIEAFNPPVTLKTMKEFIEKNKAFFEKDSLVTQEEAAPAKADKAAPTTADKPKEEKPADEKPAEATKPAQG